jgi:hypothetical protein
MCRHVPIVPYGSYAPDNLLFTQSLKLTPFFSLSLVCKGLLYGGHDLVIL